jgi:hypothetical protein
LLRECGLLWQHWHTVQVDPAQAELKTYWHQLDEATQALLKTKCADGEVYQHVVRAQPATEAAHLQRLEHDRVAMIAAQEVQAQSWMLEKQALTAHYDQLAWTESQLQNHKHSIEELHAEIEVLKQSTSWRITAPLRKLLRKISD